ncbi:hypothetical protein T12_3145 [Trichinella patagoniensis]|uniref:Uncharacterized protein n=1 Tax=Trichinella patagoniensis TaxID=990121 RepID=A0A0V0ZT46_9BILA|nr:hypothetical protein T12_3145 [Trichinella patagoniensis]
MWFRNEWRSLAAYGQSVHWKNVVQLTPLSNCNPETALTPDVDGWSIPLTDAPSAAEMMSSVDDDALGQRSGESPLAVLLLLLFKDDNGTGIQLYELDDAGSTKKGNWTDSRTRDKCGFGSKWSAMGLVGPLPNFSGRRTRSLDLRTSLATPRPSPNSLPTSRRHCWEYYSSGALPHPRPPLLPPPTLLPPRAVLVVRHHH